MMMMSGKFCDLDHKALITGKRLINSYFRSTSGPVVSTPVECHHKGSNSLSLSVVKFLNEHKAVNIFDRFQADHSISIHPHFCPSQCLVSQPRVGKKRKQSICKMCSIHKVIFLYRFHPIFTPLSPQLHLNFTPLLPDFTWRHPILLDLIDFFSWWLRIT